MTATPKLNLDELAVSIVRCFPTLNLLEQRLRDGRAPMAAAKINAIPDVAGWPRLSK
jgi:hypothetical protein